MKLQGHAVLGIDLGSRNVKFCVMKEGRVLETGTVETMEFYRRYGTGAGGGFRVELAALHRSGVERVVATGYGRTAAAISGAENISELTAHFLGARFQTGLTDFTLIDMGGQDYKVMRIENGSMTDMATNDKCAASTGRYIENMARVLGLTLDEMGAYHENPVPLSSTCAIFGESEVIGLVVRGEPVHRLAAGVNRAVVERVLPLIERMGGETIVMSGGVALNRAVVRIMGDLTGRRVVVVRDPLYNGAMGCCLKGLERIADSS